MNDKYYERLGHIIDIYAKSEKFTDIELGKAIENFYKILSDEEMRDLREVENKK